MSEQQRKQRWQENHPEVQLPWSEDGWFADSRKAAESSELDAVVEESRGRGVDPRGYRERRPGVTWGPAMHNPYPSIVLAIGLVGVGVFVLNKLGTESIGAWCVAGFFWLMGTTTLVLTAIRIPGWHKARRGVRRHIRVNGGEMPDDLKWYR